MYFIYVSINVQNSCLNNVFFSSSYRRNVTLTKYNSGEMLLRRKILLKKCNLDENF